MPQEKLTIGGKVHALGVHITNEAECRRRYGSAWKTKLLNGRVISIENRLTKTGRRQNYVKAKYKLGYSSEGVTKEVTLNVRSVKNGWTLLEQQEEDERQAPLVEIEAAPPAEIEAAPPAEIEADQVSHCFNAESIRLFAPEQEDGASPLPSLPSIGTTPVSVADPPSILTTPSTETEVSPTTTPLPPLVLPPLPAATTNQPKATAHGYEWYEDDCTESLNELVRNKAWGIKSARFGDATVTIQNQNLHETGKMSRLDMFMEMFPSNHIVEVLQNTNTQLSQHNLEEVKRQELLKFFGILILITRFEFCSRSSLWSTTAPSKYLPAAGLGRTGMSRRRFDNLFRHMRFSNQPEERPEGMKHGTHRWMLVQDFVDAFNEHRAANFVPSHKVCVDESMSRWYGQGGFWINRGLPCYIAIDRKPDNGAEIQNAACGESGIMIRLKIVKGAEDNEEDDNHDDDDDLPHGCKVLMELVEPWNFSNRIVCADSYFASVTPAEELGKVGLRFIGVIKTATRKYPLAELQSTQFEKRGEWRGLKYKEDDGDSMYAFVWVDRDRRYFITNCLSLSQGKPFIRKRWRQVRDRNSNADAEYVEFEIEQPEVAEIYYDVCAKIDQHNRKRSDHLMLEKKIDTHDWSKRFNLTILGITIVDTFLAFRGLVEPGCNEKQFYTDLAEELIDNEIDTRQTRRSRQPGATNVGEAIDTNGSPRAGVGPHLTPTKRKRPGSATQLMQKRCKVCQKKTKHVCSLCKDENIEFHCCHSETGRSCFNDHLDKKHDL